MIVSMSYFGITMEASSSTLNGSIDARYGHQMVKNKSGGKPDCAISRDPNIHDHEALLPFFKPPQVLHPARMRLTIHAAEGK
ncbi:hypothetical protein Bca101_022337 [Brassica carinata]